LQKYIIHPYDQKSYEEHGRLIHDGTAGIGNLEYRIIARDGSEHWIDHICQPLFNPDNRYLRRRVSNRDSTEYKKAEQALELERTKLLNILDSMPDGIYIVNQEYDIQYINPALEREFGNVSGRKCYQYFHDRTEVCEWCKN
jgi:PAS domain-containing protein